jgi:heavy metal sensor kinase
LSFFLHSVRWRLQLWHALILASVIALLCMLVYRLAAEDRAERIDNELESFEKSFIRRIWEQASARHDGPPSGDEMRQHLNQLGDAADFPPFMRGLFDADAKDSVYLAYWDRDGKMVFHSANAPDSLHMPKDGQENQKKWAMKGTRRDLIRRGPRGFSGIVGRDISNDVAKLHNLGWQITGFGAGLWAIGLLGGWWLAGRAIRPIEQISRTASRIATGNVSERIDIADTDNELGRLSNVLNDTFDRLETAIHRQRQFTADASHELRTPLTVILSETSRGLKRERDPAEYREVLSNCRHAAERMRSLVESLLVLARQDGSTATDAPRETCDLSTIASDAIKLLRPIADQRDIRLIPDLTEVTCPGDPRALSMVAVNLISNAIEHQEPGGEVRVKVFTRSDTDGDNASQAILEIIDRGQGIAAEHLPRLFDRFYRVDPARGASGGHSGLGLAIVKAIAENHHGDIVVESEPGHGATFRVTLPQ